MSNLAEILEATDRGLTDARALLEKAEAVRAAQPLRSGFAYFDADCACNSLRSHIFDLVQYRAAVERARASLVEYLQHDVERHAQ